MINRLLRLSLLIVVAATLGACQRAYFGLLNHGDGGDRVLRTHSIVFDPAHQLTLDVYKPAGVDRPPLLVYYYGGRWQSGSRQQHRFVGEALAARGIAVVIPEYRHYPAVRFPLFVEDAATAAAYVRTHADELGIDRQRIFLGGHSAGAHLAAMLATDARFLAAHQLKPRDFAGIIGIAGPYDFLPFKEDDLKDMFGPPDRYELSQPVNFVDGDEPPFLLLHGTSDRLAWPRNSQRLAARLQEQHEPVKLVLIPGIGHLRILASLSEHEKWLSPALQDIVEYINASGSVAP